MAIRFGLSSSTIIQEEKNFTKNRQKKVMRVGRKNKLDFYFMYSTTILDDTRPVLVGEQILKSNFRVPGIRQIMGLTRGFNTS